MRWGAAVDFNFVENSQSFLHSCGEKIVQCPDSFPLTMPVHLQSKSQEIFLMILDLLERNDEFNSLHDEARGKNLRVFIPSPRWHSSCSDVIALPIAGVHVW